MRRACRGHSGSVGPRKRRRARTKHGSTGPPKSFSLERAQTITQEGQDLASNLGLAVETRIERSQASVWQTILDVAAEIDA